MPSNTPERHLGCGFPLTSEDCVLRCATFDRAGSRSCGHSARREIRASVCTQWRVWRGDGVSPRAPTESGCGRSWASRLDRFSWARMRRELSRAGDEHVARTALPLVRFGGQGRGRTADLPLFRRTLIPTELPGRAPTPRTGDGATQTGLEPATFAVTGRRANQLRHWALLVLSYPQRDSNPRCRLERAVS
jgi:hypothetical protein